VGVFDHLKKRARAAASSVSEEELRTFSFSIAGQARAAIKKIEEAKDEDEKLVAIAEFCGLAYREGKRVGLKLAREITDFTTEIAVDEINKRLADI
jgi:hypothetical protein